VRPTHSIFQALVFLCFTGTEVRAQRPECLTALDAHRQGNFPEAIAEYRKCLEGEPLNFQARSNLGAALAHEGRFADAVEQDKAALKLAPADAVVPLRMNLGLAFYKSGQLAAAAAEFGAILVKEPANRKAAVLLADCRLNSGDSTGAIALLAPLETDAPNDRTVDYLIGAAYLRIGNVAAGQKYLGRILRDGDSAEGRLLLGTGMMKAGNFPAALIEFAKAAALNPSLPSVQSFYGQVLLRTGDADGASEAFRRELLQQPADFEANLQLGQILIARKHFAEARPLLERAIQLRDGSVEAHLSLAELERSSGRSEVAAREQRIALSMGASPSTNREAPNDGPPVGSTAPEFSLIQLGSTKLVSLRQLHRSKPVVLIFGSYTCPQLRAASGVLNQLYSKFGNSVSFVLVYIREAHSAGSWQSTINARENIALSPAATTEEKVNHAALCIRKLHIPYAAVVDSMDGKTEQAYASWPSRIYLVDRAGKIAFRTRLGELDFSPKQVEDAIASASKGQ